MLLDLNIALNDTRTCIATRRFGVTARTVDTDFESYLPSESASVVPAAPAPAAPLPAAPQPAEPLPASAELAEQRETNYAETVSASPAKEAAEVRVGLHSRWHGTVRSEMRILTVESLIIRLIADSLDPNFYRGLLGRLIAYPRGSG